VVIDAYNAGLGERKAIYKYYAQAIPSGYAIDAENCRQLGHGKKCGICAKICPAEAVNYQQEEQVLDLEVGAVIVASGFQAFDPQRLDVYLYGHHPNVVTALEFERLLSAGGPTSGHLMRPSELGLPGEMAKVEKELNKLNRQIRQREAAHSATTAEPAANDGEVTDASKSEPGQSLEELVSSQEKKLSALKRKQEETHEPKRIAWLQCVGSRDVHHCKNGYCSGVCCMYAIKEALIAKEHAKGDLDAAIFFMDMRTYGKEFEQYYNRARESGIRFIRSRIHRVEPIPESDNQIGRAHV
jgi:heterodisulfide reductase subunit A-like polyferredoxin